MVLQLILVTRLQTSSCETFMNSSTCSSHVARCTHSPFASKLQVTALSSCTLETTAGFFFVKRSAPSDKWLDGLIAEHWSWECAVLGKNPLNCIWEHIPGWVRWLCLHSFTCCWKRYICHMSRSRHDMPHEPDRDWCWLFWVKYEPH